MRVRHIIIVASITFAVGGAVWLYDNAGQGLGTGTGGLPLIKAQVTPVRSQPDDPGGEVVPHADSTVFAAMARHQDADPSMTGLKLPEAPAAETAPEADADTPDSPEFAGLNTGFALRPAPQPKVESLFTTEEPGLDDPTPTASESAPVDENSAVPPVTPDQPEPDSAEKVTPLVEKTQETTPAAPVENPVKKPPQVTEGKEKTADPKPSEDQPGLAARNMEAQEMQALAPKTPVPAVLPPVLPVAKPAPLKLADAQPKTEPETRPTPPVTRQPAPAQTPAQQTQPAPRMQDPDAPYTPPARVTKSGTASPAANAGGYVIQLSSMPSQAEAERSWAQMVSMYPEALRGLSPSYVSAAIEGRGTFIRVRAGVLSRAEANARCEQIRREDPRGGGCLVVRQ